jgi:predicted metal-dependent hydrolase
LVAPPVKCAYALFSTSTISVVSNNNNNSKKKQKEYRETIPEITRPSFGENTYLPYLGKNYSVKIKRNQARDNIDLADGKFVVIAKSKISSNRLKKLYESWLREKAEVIFEDKVKKHYKKLGVSIKRITIKNLKNRWGSLTKSGVIILNVNLIKAPEDIIDYIVLHELCHLKVKEHSHHYWDLVRRFMPNYQDKVQWLKVNGYNLI